VSRLAAVDLTERLGRREYEERLAHAQQRWLQLRLHIGGQMGTGELGPGLLLVFEGSDAAGKGGAIRRVVEPLDPRHYRVSTFGAPTYDEKRHAFLWRFYPYLPGHGGLSLFDRSWYGRVLVERVEGFATPEEWGRAYEEIVTFERMIVNEGIILVKFWLHISSAEQLRRFTDRESDPLRRWKITDEDWRNREKADQYVAAAEEMFERTDHHLAPWDLIAGEQKRLGRVRVLETLITRVEQGMVRWGMEVPSLAELTTGDGHRR
jgi:polyphosphate kinase 2 (PPK2 family)